MKIRIRHLNKFKKIIKNFSNEDFLGLDKAIDGIGCYRCGTEKDVYYYGDNVLTVFMCLDCLKITRDEPEEICKESKGLTLRFKVLMRDGFRCVYCGRNPKEDGVKLEVDHVYPKSLGGQDTMENLVTACWECNQGKRDMVIEEN